MGLKGRNKVAALPLGVRLAEGRGSRQRGQLGRTEIQLAVTAHFVERDLLSGPSERDEGLADAFEFPNVAGPVICKQRAHRVAAEPAQPLLGPPLLAREEVPQEHRNITGTAGQRRQPYRQRLDALIKVLAEPALLDVPQEVAVGRGDELHVHGNLVGGAEGQYAPAPERAEQDALSFERQLRDLVEEERPAIRRAERAGLCVDCSGECAARVAEENGLRHLATAQGRAVDDHVLGLAAYRRVVVQVLGDLVLADPGRPEDQYRRGILQGCLRKVRRVEQLAEAPDRLAVPHDFRCIGAAAALPLLFELAVTALRRQVVAERVSQGGGVTLHERQVGRAVGVDQGNRLKVDDREGRARPGIKYRSAEHGMRSTRE